MTLLGPEHHRPFPDIRFPGEPKLDGPPKSAKESVFDRQVVDALDVVNPLQDAKSDEFRSVVAELGGLTTHRLMRLHGGLSDIVEAPLYDEERGRRIGATANRLLSRVGEMVGNREKTVETALETTFDQPDYLLIDEDWRDHLPELPGSHLPIPANHNRWHHDVAFRSAILKMKDVGLDDPRLTSTGYQVYERFISQINNEGMDPMVDAAVAFQLCHSVSNLLFVPGDSDRSMQTRHRIDRGIMYGLMERWQAYDVGRLRSVLESLKDDFRDKTTGEVHPGASDNLFILGNCLDERDALEAYIGRFVGKGVTNRLRYEVLDRSESLNKEAADALMSEVIQLRRYGVKPAVVDGTLMLANPDERWVVREPMAESPHVLDEHMTFDPMVAHFDLADASEITSLGYGSAELTERYGLKTIAYSTPYPLRASFGLSARGEIMSSSMAGVLMPVKPYFERAGADGAYQALRLYFANVLHDLVVPEARNIHGKTDVVTGKGLLSSIKRAWKDPYSRMLNISLPRTEYLHDNMQEITKELEADREQEDARAEQGGRLVRLHGVVWFVRKLPSGYSASPEARQFAQRAGVRLGENETFVRAHTRGSENAGVVNGHKVKR